VKRRGLAAWAYVRGHPGEAATLPDAELARRAGVGEHAIRAARRAMGVAKAPGARCTSFPWPLVDWRLPTSDIAEVWGCRPQVASDVRRRHGLPGAQWRRRFRGRRPEDPAHRAALRAERAKAKRWKAGRAA
jgi:hypothetical protein